MEIQDIAKRLLFGTNLQDKLFTITETTDTPGREAISIPPYPGRPKELLLQRKTRSLFPKAHELNDEKKRAHILHFFINHELLAIELMAVVLLRFPQAPPLFRKGVVQTLCEEQEHMGLYIQRIKELGVELGEIPVNDFFWKTMKDIKTPMEYVVQMSLTFEQANLDFSIYYQNLMEKLGDQKTAKLLHKVFVDELNHVKFGFQWFKKWQNPELSHWQNYCANLTFPITPMRGKGTYFYRDIRERIGFDDDYINQLEVFSQSKGKAPCVHLFNPGCETDYQQSLLSQSCKFVQKNKMTLQFTEDLESLPMFYSQTSDVILVKEKPSTLFLKNLKHAGFSIPEFKTYRDDPLEALKQITRQRKIQNFSPWGWTPHLSKTCSDREIPTQVQSSVTQLRDVFSKIWSLELSKEFLTQSGLSGKDSQWPSVEITGQVFKCVDDIREHVNLWHRERGLETHPLVIKCPYGLSGQGQRVLKNPSQWEQIKPWVSKNLQQQAQLIVEPWLEKIFDFSIQLDVRPQQPIFKGIARFLTDDLGHYMGALINNPSGFLSPSSKDFLYCRDNWKKSIEELASFVNNKLSGKGYHGPIGIDCLLYRDRENARLYFKPLVEINPRYNMGRITAEFDSHIKNKSVGIWLTLHRNQISKYGFNHILDFSEHMKKKFPLETSTREDLLHLHRHPVFISSGYIETSPVKSSSYFLSFLLTATSEGKLSSMLEDSCPSVSSRLNGEPI